jgi:putative copper export protein
MYGIFLLLHVLSATVWTGGHLVLTLTILPRVVREKSPAELLRFESVFERIGLPALFIQVVTGLWFANRMMPDITQWFAFDNPVSRLLMTKLFLLAITVVLALDSRLRLIPKLSVNNLPSLAWHIVVVTIVSVLFVIVGVSFRSGWLV